MATKADVVIKPVPEYQEQSSTARYTPASHDRKLPGTYYVNLYQPEKQSKGGDLDPARPGGAGDRDRPGPEGGGCMLSIFDPLCSPYDLPRRLSVLETIVGSAAAEKVLLYLQNYEQACGREISEKFQLSNSQVQKQLLKLEPGGLLVSRRIGRTRLYQWNLRNPLVPSLRAFLAVALDSLPANEQQQFFRKRTRPRRSGKAL
jgi:biotin operon repressor